MDEQKLFMLDEWQVFFRASVDIRESIRVFERQRVEQLLLPRYAILRNRTRRVGEYGNVPAVANRLNDRHCDANFGAQTC